MSRLYHTVSDERQQNTARGQRRFRGYSPSRTYAAKVRWLVATLVSLVALLGIALGVLYAQFGEKIAVAPDQIAEKGAPLADGKVRMLIAAKRIEAGQQLEDALFETQEISKSLTPQGAVLVADLPSIRGQYAKTLIFSGFPLSFENISSRALAEDFDIPPGYRAISIAIDEMSSVSYKVRPNHRVDVLLSFTYQGQPAVIPVVETAKVVAVGVETDPKGNTVGSKTATLLVSSEDAKKIELAKQHGKLSLVRAGDSEPPKITSDPNPTTLKQFFSPQEAAPAPREKIAGKMFVTDTKTGRQSTYVLVNGQWKVEGS